MAVSSEGRADEPRDSEGLIFVSDASAEAARLSVALRARGYALVEVPLGLLQNRVAVQRPSLILCDADAESALDTIRSLREIPGGDGIDIVFLGDKNGAIQRMPDALTHEASGVFARPVEVYALLRKVEALIGPPNEAFADALSPSSNRSPVLVASSRKPYRYEGHVRRSSNPAPPSSPAPPPSNVLSSRPPATPDRSPDDELAASAATRSSSPAPAEPRAGPPSLGPPGSAQGSGWIGRIPQAELSPELKRLLAHAEQQLGHDVEKEGAPRLSPEAEVEAVLPAEVLAALDEPLGDADDDELEADGGTSSGSDAGRTSARHAANPETSPGTDERRQQPGSSPPSVKDATALESDQPQSMRAAGVGSPSKGAEEPSPPGPSKPPVMSTELQAPSLQPLPASPKIASSPSAAAGELTTPSRPTPPPPSAHTAAGGETSVGTETAAGLEAIASNEQRKVESSPPSQAAVTSVEVFLTDRPLERSPNHSTEVTSPGRQTSRPGAFPQTGGFEPLAEPARHVSTIPPREPDGPSRSDAPPEYRSLSDAPAPRRPPERGAAPEVPTTLTPGATVSALAGAVRGRATGALACEDKRGIRRVVFRDGDVVIAASSAESETLLEFLVERGDLPLEVATSLGRRIPPYGRHAGAALIAHGHLRQEDLWSVLRAHAEWLLGIVINLQAGNADWEPAVPERLQAEPAVFGGAAGAEVLVEVIRRSVQPEVALARLGGPRKQLEAGHAANLLDECALVPEDEDFVRRAPGTALGDLAPENRPELLCVLYGLVELGVLARADAAPLRNERLSREPVDDPLDDVAMRQHVKQRLALVEEGDYFAVLGVSRGATAYDIRRAYTELKRTYAPERVLTARNADLRDDVDVIQEVLDEAFEILSDNLRRERYRRALDATPD